MLARLQEVQKEIDSLFVTQTRFPCLGVQVNTEDLSVKENCLQLRN